MNWVVYVHINKITNDVFYVGIGKNKRRPYAKYNRSERWNNYVDKYGYPLVLIAYKNLSHEEAIAKEQMIISLYGRKKYESNGALVNLSLGGKGSTGVKCSEERKTNQSIRMKGDKNPNYGRTHTESARKKISQSKIGRKLSDAHKQKIVFGLRGVPHPSLGKKLSDDHRKALSISASLRTGSNNGRARKVINNETGNVYGCVKDAAEVAGYSYSYFKDLLQNSRVKNNTQFNYCN